MRVTALRAAFPEHAYLPRTGFLHYVVEDLPLRLIALDTLVEGKGHGALSDGQLDWLEARLGESDRPTLAVHASPAVRRRHRAARCGAAA